MEDEGGLLDRLTWRQYRAWQEYAALEPFGEERGDLRAAIVASVIFNANIADARKAAPPAKFMARRWFDPTADGGDTGNGGPPTAEGWQRFKADAQALAEAAEGQRRSPRTPQPRTRKPPTPTSAVPPEA